MEILLVWLGNERNKLECHLLDEYIRLKAVKMIGFLVKQQFARNLQLTSHFPPPQKKSKTDLAVRSKSPWKKPVRQFNLV